MRAELVSYLAAMRAAISEKIDNDSISPTNVGEDGFADLVTILDAIIREPDIFSGVGDPALSMGVDGDFYFQSGNPVLLKKKSDGAWTVNGSIDLGIDFPDGNFTIKTSLLGDTVTATSGFWYLDNNQYRKATPTEFTISSADNTLETQDLIYATTSNTILYLAGTPGLGQPALPANSVLVDVVVIPSVASGATPYLIYGQTQEVAETAVTTIDATADTNGQVDLSANAIPAYPIIAAYQNENTVPVSYDNTTKIAYGLIPDTAVKLIFIA